MAITSDTLRAQVLSIRADAASWLVSECQIKHKLSESAVNGENVIVYDTPVTTPCRFIDKSGSERSTVASQYRTPQQTFFTGQYRLQLPYDTAVDTDSKIGYSGRTFNVIYVPPFHDMMGAFIIEIQEVF